MSTARRRRTRRPVMRARRSCGYRPTSTGFRVRFGPRREGAALPSSRGSRDEGMPADVQINRARPATHGRRPIGAGPTGRTDARLCGSARGGVQRRRHRGMGVGRSPACRCRAAAVVTVYAVELAAVKPAQPLGWCGRRAWRQCGSAVTSERARAGRSSAARRTRARARTPGGDRETTQGSAGKARGSWGLVRSESRRTETSRVGGRTSPPRSGGPSSGRRARPALRHRPSVGQSPLSSAKDSRRIAVAALGTWRMHNMGTPTARIQMDAAGTAFVPRRAPRACARHHERARPQARAARRIARGELVARLGGGARPRLRQLPSSSQDAAAAAAPLSTRGRRRARSRSRATAGLGGCDAARGGAAGARATSVRWRATVQPRSARAAARGCALVRCRPRRSAAAQCRARTRRSGAGGRARGDGRARRRARAGRRAEDRTEAERQAQAAARRGARRHAGAAVTAVGDAWPARFGGATVVHAAARRLPRRRVLRGGRSGGRRVVRQRRTGRRRGRTRAQRDDARPPSAPAACAKRRRRRTGRRTKRRRTRTGAGGGGVGGRSRDGARRGGHAAAASSRRGGARKRCPECGDGGKAEEMTVIDVPGGDACGRRRTTWRRPPLCRRRQRGPTRDAPRARRARRRARGEGAPPAGEDARTAATSASGEAIHRAPAWRAAVAMLRFERDAYTDLARRALRRAEHVCGVDETSCGGSPRPPRSAPRRAGTSRRPRRRGARWFDPSSRTMMTIYGGLPPPDLAIWGKTVRLLRRHRRGVTAAQREAARHVLSACFAASVHSHPSHDGIRLSKRHSIIRPPNIFDFASKMTFQVRTRMAVTVYPVYTVDFRFWGSSAVGRC